MKPIKKISLALAAMAISGVLSGPAGALTSTEVSQIRLFVEAGDEAGLRSYLQQNLWILDDSPLSELLREFIRTPPAETIFVAFGFQNPLPVDLISMVERSKSDASLY